MFNFFNSSKDKNEQTTEQEQLTTVNKNQTAEHKENSKVHGEDGVCCGGCGGQ